MSITLSALQQQRRDTAANWTSANPTLLAGEWGYETDTGKWKVGDGSTTWTSLAYVAIPDNNGLIPIAQLLLPAGTAAAPSLTFTGDLNTGIYHSAADTLAFSTAGTGRLFINSSGNVGIGTSSPSRSLSIASTDPRIGLTDTDAGGEVLFQNTSGNGIVNVVGSHDFTIKTANSDRFIVKNTGNVGIGISTPSAPLAFGKSTYGDPSSENFYRIKFKDFGGTANDVGIGQPDEYSLGLNIEGGSTASIRFSAGTAGERMRIDSSGNVGIGTSSPSANLDIAGATYANLFLTDVAAGASAAIYGDGGAIDLRANNSTDNTLLVATGSTRFNVSGSERLRIDGSGRLLHGYSAVISKLRDAQTTTNTRSANYQQVGNGSTDAGKAYLAYHSVNSSFYSPHIWLGKSASDTKGTDALVTSGTDLGNILFTGNDGSKFVNAARILAEVDGTAAVDDMPGKLSFFTTPSGSDVPVERLVIKNDGNVGIGTTSIDASLHVKGANTHGSFVLEAGGTAGSSNQIYIQGHNHAGTSLGEIHIEETATNQGALVFKTNGGSVSERMRIDSSGNVGIRTSAPSYALDINSGDANAVRIRGTADNPLIMDATDSGPSYVSVHRAGTRVAYYGFGGSSNDFNVFNDTSTGDITFGTNGTEVARITDAGRVGVGLSSPVGPFHLVGDTSADVAGEYSILNVSDTSDTTKALRLAYDDVNDCGVVSASDRGAGWKNVVISPSGGNVGIGTSTPDRLVHIHKGSAGTAVSDGNTALMIENSTHAIIQMASPNANSARILFGDPEDADAGRLTYDHNIDAFTVHVNAAERLRIDSSGFITSTPTYNNTTGSSANLVVLSSGQFARSTSSVKYKTNIETLEDSYADALLDCRPVWYRSTCENDNPKHGWWGFIAEEVAEIDPRLVHWKTVDISHDESGSVVQTPCDPEPESVAYERFVPHLLNLIKRQQQAIETLEQRLTDAGL